MPGLAFGLKGSNSKPITLGAGPSRRSQKRKAGVVFGDDDDDVDGREPGDKQQQGGALSKASNPKISRPPSSIADKNKNSSTQPPAQSPYTNLSALRNAKLQDQEASSLDSTVYEYDSVYDTFSQARENNSKKHKDADGKEEKPKYMGSLLASAEVRKRDQLRAKEKLLQKEREAEGDEFKDKESFVTGAYKRQQEENRRLEEEEKKREEEEDERRRKGQGMTAFHRDVLKKEDARQEMIEQAAQKMQNKQSSETEVEGQEIGGDESKEGKIAEELNAQGAHIAINDDGEVVDKRQLLSAGLNVSSAASSSSKTKEGEPRQKGRERETERERQDRKNSRRGPGGHGGRQDNRQSQREDESKAMEQQILDMIAGK